MTDKEKLDIAIQALHLINLPAHIGWFKDVEKEGYDTTGLSPIYSTDHLCSIAEQALYRLDELSPFYKQWIEGKYPGLKAKQS